MQGLDAAVAQHAGRGGAVLGICGGLQMLGEALIDPHGIDGNAPGLGLLPLVTVFDAVKTVRYTQSSFHADMQGTPTGSPWARLADVEVRGYEIHHGQTRPHAAMAAAGNLARAVMPDGLAWQNPQGNVLGIYLHGLLEDPNALRALFGDASQGQVPTLDTVFDGLADFIETHFESGVLRSLLA
jgi:adenosylcobyric acid synthase